LISRFLDFFSFWQEKLLAIFENNPCLLLKFLLMRFFIGILFFFTSFSVFPQIVRKPVSAAYLATGAYSKEHVDVFSFLTNQAALAEIKNISIGVFAERRFLLNELNSYTAAIAMPTSTGNFGLKTSYYGFSSYNETQIGLAYGRKLGSKIDMGAQFDYSGTTIPGYGNASALSFEIGMLMHITDKLHAGIQVNNPAGGKFGKAQQEKLSSVYSFGFGYEASDKFLFSIQTEKEEDQPVNVNAGMEYDFLPQLKARAGISSATSTMWFGAGLSWKNIRVDITSSYHPVLGISPGLLFVFNPGQNKK
jgi:hypothetical protein